MVNLAAPRVLSTMTGIVSNGMDERHPKQHRNTVKAQTGF